jgi:hypothetical protein
MPVLSLREAAAGPLGRGKHPWRLSALEAPPALAWVVAVRTGRTHLPGALPAQVLAGFLGLCVAEALHLAELLIHRRKDRKNYGWIPRLRCYGRAPCWAALSGRRGRSR